jgi:hypothetical protein
MIMGLYCYFSNSNDFIYLVLWTSVDFSLLWISTSLCYISTSLQRERMALWTGKKFHRLPTAVRHHKVNFICLNHGTFWNIGDSWTWSSLWEFLCKISLQESTSISNNPAQLLSLSLFLSVFCAACQCFETLFSVLNTCHF